MAAPMWEQHPSRGIQDPVALLASAYHLHAFTEACVQELEAGLWLILKSKASLLTSSCCGWATAERTEPRLSTHFIICCLYAHRLVGCSFCCLNELHSCSFLNLSKFHLIPNPFILHSVGHRPSY